MRVRASKRMWSDLHLIYASSTISSQITCIKLSRKLIAVGILHGGKYKLAKGKRTKERREKNYTQSKNLEVAAVNTFVYVLPDILK